VIPDGQWPTRVAERLTAKLREQPAARICLPTGETPRAAYRLAAPKLDLSAATVFLLDEFELPLGSSARCDFMLQRDLLGRLQGPPVAYHRLEPNVPNPAGEIDRFDTLVSEGGLDLLLLGMGNNGHVGLNEPGSGPDSPTRQTRITASTTEAAARYDANASPTAGMTLGMDRILAAREIWLLVTGQHKAATLRRMLFDPIGPELPVSLLRRHPNLVLLADQSAASML
jgi:glucosamine-6-phosphate deaminase